MARMMPIHVPIYVNQTLIKTYTIGRVSGDTNPDSINTYLITEEGFPWETGQMFNHRYGDSIETCVTKGLSAMIDT
jgi:hypothetical protein